MPAFAGRTQYGDKKVKVQPEHDRVYDFLNNLLINVQAARNRTKEDEQFPNWSALVVIQ